MPNLAKPYNPVLSPAREVDYKTIVLLLNERLMLLKKGYNKNEVDEVNKVFYQRLGNALWFEEFECSPMKWAIRYRTRDAERYDSSFEHVTTRKFIIYNVLFKIEQPTFENIKYALDILSIHVIVSKTEHNQLKANSFIWQRYILAGIEVIDGKDGSVINYDDKIREINAVVNSKKWFEAGLPELSGFPLQTSENITLRVKAPKPPTALNVLETEKEKITSSEPNSDLEACYNFFECHPIHEMELKTLSERYFQLTDSRLTTIESQIKASYKSKSLKYKDTRVHFEVVDEKLERPNGHGQLSVEFHIERIPELEPQIKQQIEELVNRVSRENPDLNLVFYKKHTTTWHCIRANTQSRDSQVTYNFMVRLISLLRKSLCDILETSNLLAK